MQKIIVITAALFTLNASAQAPGRTRVDPKQAAEFLMFHPDLIQSALSKLPPFDGRRCYPYVHYRETFVEFPKELHTRTIYRFDYECQRPDENIRAARIELIEDRFNDQPRDDVVRYETRVTPGLASDDTN